MTPAQKLGLFMAVTVVTMAAVFLAPPIAQPLSFHHFADDRPLWGIPNFGNVVSNIPFVLIGVYGIWMVAIFAGQDGLAFFEVLGSKVDALSRGVSGSIVPSAVFRSLAQCRVLRRCCLM